jgi:hypothetical protein
MRKAKSKEILEYHEEETTNTLFREIPGCGSFVTQAFTKSSSIDPKDRPTAEEVGAQPKYFIVYCQLIKKISGYCETLNIISISEQMIMT